MVYVAQFITNTLLANSEVATFVLMAWILPMHIPSRAAMVYAYNILSIILVLKRVSHYILEIMPLMLKAMKTPS